MATASEYYSWTNKQLSSWLSERGLKCTGSKNALLNRVHQALEGGNKENTHDEPISAKTTTKPKYCCVPECHNTSSTVLEDGHQVMLHRLPANKETSRLWIQRLKTVRKNLVINDNTRVCSAHFKDHDKCNLPTLFPSKKPKTLKPRRPLIRESYGVTSPEHCPSQTEDFLEGQIFAESCESTSTNSKPDQSGQENVRCDASEHPPQTTKTRDAQTQTYLSFGTTSTTSVTGTQTGNVPDITLEDLENNDDKTRFYTGFCSFQMFFIMFTNLMKHGGANLNYWRGEQSVGDRAYHLKGQKPGPRRSLRPEDEFLMTCMRLRLGLLQEHLGDIFKVSTCTVSRILNTWINFIYDCSQDLVPWPSAEQILYNLPRAFLDFPNTQIVLDCTEIFIEKPSSVVGQWQTWSEYKHHNTMKLLIGVTPNGTVNFVSRLWGGRASDRHITMEENILAKIDPGMVVMADKGFTIEDLLPPQVHLNVPPRIPSARPMTESEVFKTGHIASARIVVEMKMEQAKNYRCLQGILPLSEVHLIEQMAFICFSWTNLLPPLFKK